MAFLRRTVLGRPKDVWRDGLREGLQSAVAAAATYQVLGWLGRTDEAFIGVLSAVMILTPSAGGTMGAAGQRLMATLVGSLLALACLLVLPEGWGTTAALAVSTGVVGAAATLRSAWSYGVVAAVGVALASRETLLQAAVDRFVVIAIGVGVGVLVALVVWRDTAERRFERHVRAALRAAADRLGDALEEAKGDRARRNAETDKRWQDALSQADDAARVAKFVDRAPMERRLAALRALQSALVVLDSAAAAVGRGAEGDPPIGEGGEGLGQELGRLRATSRDVLTRLADRADRPGERIGEMDGVLEALLEDMAGDDPATPRHRDRAALAFALHEVRRTLVDLIEATREGERGDGDSADRTRDQVRA